MPNLSTNLPRLQPIDCCLSASLPVANLECAETLVDEVRGLGGKVPDANESEFYKQ